MGSGLNLISSDKSGCPGRDILPLKTGVVLAILFDDLISNLDIDMGCCGGILGWSVVDLMGYI